jgi:hypothetical protein
MKTSEQIHKASKAPEINIWKQGHLPALEREEALTLALRCVEKTGAFTRENDVRACTEGKAPHYAVWIACGQSVWMVVTDTVTREAFIKHYQP